MCGCSIHASPCFINAPLILRGNWSNAFRFVASSVNRSTPAGSSLDNSALSEVLSALLFFPHCPPLLLFECDYMLYSCAFRAFSSSLSSRLLTPVGLLSGWRESHK